MYTTLLFFPAGIMCLLLGANLVLKGIVQVVSRPKKDESGRVKRFSGRGWGVLILTLGAGSACVGLWCVLYFAKIFPRMLR